MYKSCGALLRNVYMEGNQILGEVETLSGFHGPDIAKMVLYDKVNIGFSLRALGSVNTRPDGTIEVLSPIKPITYDLVSNPSHAKARVLEFLPESVDLSSVDEQSGVLCESVGTNEDILLLQEDGIMITNNADLPERHFVEEILKSRFDGSLKHMRFRF